MTHLVEKKLEAIARAGEPDYEIMWGRIEKRLGHVRPITTRPGISGNKKKTIILAASVAIMTAVPVVASVHNSGWESLWNGQSSYNAIELGLGNRLDHTVTSGGIAMTLNGVATDDQRMNILLTMDDTDLPAYDVVTFDRSQLASEKGVEDGIQVQLKHVPEEGRLYGLATVQNNLGDGRERYQLTLDHLVFYKYTSVPVAIKPAQSQGKAVQLVGSPAKSIAIISTIRENNVLTVRYELNGVNDYLKHNPQLQLVSGDQVLKPQNSALLPSEKPNVLLRQSTFNISDADLAKARFELAALEEAGRKEGSWRFDFKAAGKKAAQAIFAMTLNPDTVVNDSYMKFTELVVTPLEIRLMYDEKQNFPEPGQPLIQYETVKLIADGRELDSGTGFNTTEDGRYYRRFELPSWYEQKAWGSVPIQVILSGQKAQERAEADHAVTLAQPSASKKTATTEQHGATVTFTYYKDGKDLMVESASDNPLFGGITQSYLNINGERMFPELNPTPPGGNGTNRKVERYVNVPNGDLTLNPFLYVWFDPKATTVLQLQ
ncbi:DUF4179 domain-containing protein [Paenibacillus sp. PL2-23]|uniref:DUF4179 domain-containing protein n=1 Tax=Paenibacillus sp. PL2-23 TaxID=2100729 RepID=UPI0030FBA838